MDKNSIDKLRVSTDIRLEILPKFKSTLNCPVPECADCNIACTMKCNTEVIKQDGIQEKEIIIL